MLHWFDPSEIHPSWPLASLGELGVFSQKENWSKQMQAAWLDEVFELGQKNAIGLNDGNFLNLLEEKRFNILLGAKSQAETMVHWLGSSYWTSLVSGQEIRGWLQRWPTSAKWAFYNLRDTDLIAASSTHWQALLPWLQAHSVACSPLETWWQSSAEDQTLLRVGLISWFMQLGENDQLKAWAVCLRFPMDWGLVEALKSPRLVNLPNSALFDQVTD